MKNRSKLLLVISLFALTIIIISCTDSLEKTISFAESVRIEYSDCTGCQECILDFSCPENAIKFDSLRAKTYIDADKCIQCMECINLFNCPDDAFTLIGDNIPPAGIEEMIVYSDSIGTLEITFQATGDDSISGRAFRYKLQLIDENEEDITTEFIPPIPINAGFQEHWLIPGLQQDMLITVTIQAFDEVNNASPVETAIVTIMGNDISPAAISDLTIINIGSEDFELNWTAVGNNGLEGLAAYYEVKIHTEEITESNWNEIADYEQNLVPANSGTQEGLLIEGLEFLTEYFAAVKAVDDSANVAAISNIVFATTLETTDLVAPGTISDLSVNSVGMNSFTLNWTSVGDDDLIGTASSYIIKVHTEEITNENWVSLPEIEQNLIPAISGEIESFIVIGLDPVTSYFAAVKAVDEANNISLLSNIANTVTTEIPDTDPPAAIDDLQAVGSEADIELIWTAPGDDGSIGTAFYYEIRYSETEIMEANWVDAILLPDPPSPISAGSQQNYLATGLDVGIEYYFAIKAFDESENAAPISNVPTASLIEDNVAPAIIIDLTAAGTESEIELSWTAPGDDGDEGTADHYEIRIHDAEITTANWNDAEILTGAPWPLIAGSPQDYTVEGLEHNVTYFFGIKAFDDNSNVSDVSNSPSGMLINDIIPPADITNLSVYAGYATNLSTIKIQWTAPGDNGDEGTCDHYEIRYSLTLIDESNWDAAILFNDPPTPLAAGTNQFCNVTGLNSATIYYFAVKAFDEVGNVNIVSNSPAGKIVYQINTAACHNCNNCINDCSYGAILQGSGYKYIDSDLCEACGDCTCPWNLIYQAVVAY